jgi:hypothetical protein
MAPDPGDDGAAMNILRVSMLVCLLLLSGCGRSPQQKQLDETQAFVVKRLYDIRRHPSQYILFEEQVLSGTSPVNLIMGGAPTSASSAPVLWSEPAQPWSVVVASGDKGSFVVDAYGESSEKAVHHESVDMRR